MVGVSFLLFRRHATIHINLEGGLAISTGLGIGEDLPRRGKIVLFRRDRRDTGTEGLNRAKEGIINEVI